MMITNYYSVTHFKTKNEKILLWESVELYLRICLSRCLVVSPKFWAVVLGRKTGEGQNGKREGHVFLII